MTERLKISIAYFLSAGFILLNTYLVYKEFYWGIFIPLSIILLLLYFYKLDKVLLLAALVTPLSVSIGDYDLGISISIPSEPLLIGITAIFLLKVMFEGWPEKSILKHPVSIAVFINLAWLFITSCTSSLPLVSFKYLLSRLWFVIPLFFAGTLLFKEYGNIRQYLGAYILALMVVIGITTYKHSGFAFSERAGHWVMQPFYNDHTAYGMILALLLPVTLGVLLDRNYSRRMRIISAGVAVVLITALYLSFSRAAWMSFVVAFGVLILALLKIKFRYVLITTATLLAIFFTFKFEILDKLEKNKQDASANFIEHIQSISNISSDASNLERINRWQSALRMYQDRKFFGFGPGTYQFQYAPFQRASEKTIISTNLGDLGNAHSEYIGPLAETGFIGMLTVFGLVITILYTGFRVYRYAEEKKVKILALSITLGFVTYFVHGTMNNFLDTDKASVPFWGMAAILVALDRFHSRKNTESNPN